MNRVPRTAGVGAVLAAVAGAAAAQVQPTSRPDDVDASSRRCDDSPLADNVSAGRTEADHGEERP